MKLLPDSIKLFLVNRLLEISGVASILLSIFILISIVSYSSFDPSILNLNNYEVKNIGGYIGANVSEILIQFFGYSSFLICIALTSWAYKLFFSKKSDLAQIGSSWSHFEHLWYQNSSHRHAGSIPSTPEA